jgi:tetratricopeptide (TPR) repeat protein
LWLIMKRGDQPDSRVGGWVAGVDLASWFVAEAVEAYGDQVLADASPDAAGPQAAGRELARLIFARTEAATVIPAPLAAVIDRSGSGDAEHALETCIGDLLGADPDLAAAVADVLGRYYQQQLDSGDGQALTELGDLLWWDEPELARTAFERAAGTGNNGALIRLAQHRWVVLEDYEGSLPRYQQAIASPDPGVAAEALTGLGEAHRAHGDYQAARDVLEECIATGHPDWAPRAMMMLGNMLEYQLRDYDGARAMLQAAISTGHPESGPEAMFLLGHLMQRTGDDDGAKAAYQHLADSAPPGSRGRALCQLANLLQRRGDSGEAKAAWQQVLDTEPASDQAEEALSGLLNQLGSEGDLGGLRAAHQAGMATSNPWAPYALVVIGRVLQDRGDPDGWRDAWQQAIDAGYEDADDLLEELSPPAEDEEGDEPADVPPEFDPQNMARTGIAVLENGLPSLPEPLTHRMAIPMAYWAARDTAVVLFLNFHRHRRTWHPAALMATFTRQDGEWKPDTHWHGTSFHDPFTDPGGRYGLDGRPIASSGGLGDIICHGTAAPAVKYLALIQDGHEDRRPLDNHFGAWVIRADKPGQLAVAALDENGTTLAEIELTDP